MQKSLALVLALACGACATTEPTRHAQAEAPAAERMADRAVDVPASVAQGSLLLGTVPRGDILSYDGRPLRVSATGRFVIGIAREQVGPLSIRLTAPDGSSRTIDVAITPRAFPLERVNGVPEKTVNPPPDIAARIAREQAAVDAVRERDDDRSDFDTAYAWPVKGRISGRFGSQRIYNGTPASPHSGVDIAAPQGTAIHAPAGGIVTYANPDLYLTGGTVVLDHGHGVSSTFLHMSRIDVKVGDRVEQGGALGLVGKTGRATGPHMHWGMNWFHVRVDPQSLMPPGDPK